VKKRFVFLLLFALAWGPLKSQTDERNTSLDVLRESIQRTFPNYRSIRLFGQVIESVPQEAMDKLTEYHRKHNDTFEVFPAKRVRLISYDRLERMYHYDERLYATDDEKREKPLMAEEIFWDNQNMLSLNHTAKAAVVSTSPQEPLSSDLWVPENIFLVNGTPYDKFISENEEHFTPVSERSDIADAEMFRFKIPYTLKDVLRLHPDAQIPDKLREGLKQGRNPVVANEEVDFFVKRSEPRFVCGIRQRGPDGKVYQELTVDEVFELDNGILFPKTMKMVRDKLERRWNVERVEIDTDISESLFQGRAPSDYLVTDKNIDVTYEMADAVKAAAVNTKIKIPTALKERSNTQNSVPVDKTARPISPSPAPVVERSPSDVEISHQRAQTAVPSIMVYLPPFLVLIGLLVFVAPPGARYGFRNRYTRQDPRVWRLSSRVVGSAIVILSFLIYALFPSGKPENILIADIVCVAVLLLSMVGGYMFSRWLFLRSESSLVPPHSRS
jgi:hypothetical protein